MLFNSHSFIFLFLPLTCLGYWLVGRLGSRQASLAWIVLCSIVFYGAWNPVNLLIIFPSIAINYGLALAIRRQVARGDAGQRAASWTLGVGVLFNLCFLGYFKYKNFFLGTANDLFGTDFALAALILPLGISFITFQKIAFLVDVRAQTIRDFDLYDFLVFVFFFPQLIAGPIVHYREMMPQFDQLKYRFDARDVAVGLCLFSIGLFKKVVLADGVAVYATPVFALADQHHAIDFASAWIGALAYTFQMYFDFSGYSDMAIGLARLFGIRLPVNFNSPLKASSIIDFWGRWHMTLTRFLTAYIYTPVVMGLTRRRMNERKPVLGRGKPTLAAFALLVAWPTVLTMFLSGFWHGAGFTFLLWGLLHGAYLCINHAWRYWRPRWENGDKIRYERVMRPLGFVMTFVAVVVAMVLFRARSVAAAGHVLHGMLGLDGVTLPEAILERLGALGRGLEHLGIGGDLNSGTGFAWAVMWLVALFLVTTCLPNSLDLMRRFEPALGYVVPKPAGTASSPVLVGSRLAAVELRLSMRWAAAMAFVFALAAMGLNRVSEFLYWQF